MIPIGDENFGRRRPFVNYALIGTASIVFLLQGVAPGGAEAVFRAWGLVPLRLLTEGPFAAYILVTHIFLHANLLHLAGNMLFLWVFGDNIEDEFGHFRYLLFFLGTGVLAGLASTALRPTSPVPGIGASGAISAVLGAYFVLFPLNEIRVVILHPLTLLMLLWSFFLDNRPQLPQVGVSAWILLLGYVAYNIVGALMGFVTPSPVDSVAHLGGFLSGYLLVFVLRRRFGLWPDAAATGREDDAAVLSGPAPGMVARLDHARRLRAAGSWAEAGRELAAALDMDDLHGDARTTIEAYYQLAEVLSHQGDHAAALEQVAAGRTLARRRAYEDLAVRADLVAAQIAGQQGDTATARSLVEQALTWVRSQAVPTIYAARLLLDTATIVEQLGDTTRGVALRREGAQAFIRARDRHRAVDVLDEVGKRLTALGDQHGARSAWEEGLRLARAIYYTDGERRLRIALTASPDGPVSTTGEEAKE